jgi:flagellar basal body-associated protein FliL
MADEEVNEEEIVVKKSGNSQIMIMFVLCISVIVLTPFAVLYALRVFDGAEKEKVTDNPGDKYAEVTMSTISVNIAESGSQHIAVVDLTLHLTPQPEMSALFGDAKDGAKSLSKVFQAAVIDILRVQTMKDLEGEASKKKKLENQIKVKLNQVKSELAADVPGQVLRVFFSKYMLQ